MESSSEIDLGNTSCESDRFCNVRQHPTLLRHRSTTLKDNMEDGFVLLESPENEIEEKKMEQNYMVCFVGRIFFRFFFMQPSFTS